MIANSSFDNDLCSKVTWFGWTTLWASSEMTNLSLACLAQLKGSFQNVLDHLKNNFQFFVPTRRYCSAVLGEHKNQNENSCSRKSRIGSISFSKHKCQDDFFSKHKCQDDHVSQMTSGLAISVSGTLWYFQQKLLPANVAIH